MKTFKRIPNQINTSVSSYNKSVKYYNQLEWKGLVENKNIYDVDQNSQADAKNVYVDTHGSLVSRPPLLGEKLSTNILPEGNTLVEVKQYSGIIVYVSKDIENKYTIVATKGNGYEVLPLEPTSYHLSNIDNFIICFNNLGAKVIDMNNVGRGWFSLQEIVDDMPFPHDGELYKNKLSTLTRKSYTFTPEGIAPTLPTDYNIDEGIDMTIESENSQTTNWHFSIIDNKLPNFDQLENLAFKQIAMSESFDNGDYDIAIGQENIICIYKHGERKIKVSRDNGATFVDKGFDSHDEMQNAKLMAISDDGVYCFIITPRAVYYLSLAEDLDTSSWYAIYPWENSTYRLEGSGVFDIVYGYYHFVTRDIFAFMTTDGKLWFMGPHLAGVPNTDYGSDERRNGLNASRIGKLGCCNIPDSLYTRLKLSSTKPQYYYDYASNDLRAYFKNIHDRGIQIKQHSGNLIQNAPAPTTTQENTTWYINANRGGNYTSVNNCITIVINSFTGVSSQNNAGPFGVMTTIILPATQCTLFNNGRVAPLDFHNKYYGGGLNSREEDPSLHYEYYKIPRDFTIIASLGNTLDASDTWNFEGSTIDPVERTIFDLKKLLRNKSNSIGAINVTGTSTNTGLWDWSDNGYDDFINSTYFTNNDNYSTYLSSKDHQPMVIRINSVNLLNNWTISTSTVTNNLVNDLGVWQIKGYMCLDRRRNLSSLTNNHEYVWITFTYEIAIYFGDTSRGYSSVDKPRLSYICFDKKLDLSIPIEASNNIINDWSRSRVALVAPYQITNTTLFDTRSNFTIKLDTSGWYTNYQYIVDKILKMPDELWPEFNAIDNSVFTNSPLIEIISIKNDIIYFKYDNKLYTNKLSSTDIGALTFTWGSRDGNYTEVPNLSFEMNGELYLGFENTLSITANTKSQDESTRGEIRLYLPFINDNKFINTISNMINISTTELAIFFENKIYICKQVEDSNIKFGYRYDYIPTKLSTGTRVGDSVINNIEGTYTIFPTRRGLAVMSYQAFMSTTDQALEYITHDIEDRYEKFYFESNKINMVQHRDYLLLANGTGHILIYNLYRRQWWYWEVPENINLMSTDQVNLKLISNKLCVFKEHERYQDFALTPNAKRIEWFIQSQPLHMKAPNYYKNLKQLVFQLLDEGQSDKKHSITVQVQCYRKKLDTKVPELINFTIDELRTFVKRFNYWKINEVQYGLADDPETLTPTRLRLNGVSIKYEIGEEVR